MLPTIWRQHTPEHETLSSGFGAHVKTIVNVLNEKMSLKSSIGLYQLLTGYFYSACYDVFIFVTVNIQSPFPEQTEK